MIILFWQSSNTDKIALTWKMSGEPAIKIEFSLEEPLTRDSAKALASSLLESYSEEPFSVSYAYGKLDQLVRRLVISFRQAQGYLPLTLFFLTQFLIHLFHFFKRVKSFLRNFTINRRVWRYLIWLRMWRMVKRRTLPTTDNGASVQLKASTWSTRDPRLLAISLWSVIYVLFL